MTAPRPVAPEWLTPARADFGLDDALKGGWGVSPAPVLRGSSFTDFGAHEMAVPFGETVEANAIRLHELMHTRFSPTRVPSELTEIFGLSSHAVRVAEEVRINYIGSHVSADLSPGRSTSISGLADGTEQATADKAVETNNWNDALSLFLSSYNTDAFRMVKRRLRRNHDWRFPLEMIEKSLSVDWGVPKDHDRRGMHCIPDSRMDTDPFEYRYRDRKNNIVTQYLPFGFTNWTLPLAEKIAQWLENPPKSVEVVKGRPNKRQIEKHHNRWETMRFGRVSLTEGTSSFISKRKRPSMTGKYPSRPDRLLTDPERRIFRESVRGRGGIVIFDCSGSMGVDHEVVRHAVAQFSGATVVVYSHSRGNGANAWIVAHNGRMIGEDEFDDLPLNRGNGIDGEVLRWAVRNRKNNKEFIVWVSDGCVTGRDDRTSHGLLEEVSLLSVKHNIIGVDTCEEALQLLADMKRGRVPRNKYCRNVQAQLTAMNRYATTTESEK